MSHGQDKDWQLPVLDRMRDDFANLNARGAEAAKPAAPPPRRRMRFGIGVIAAVIAALIALAGLEEPADREARAGVRDAPAAAARAGGFRFRTETTFRNSRYTESQVQSGVIDLPSRASRTRLSGRSSRGVERIIIGRELYFRMAGIQAAAPWQHLTLNASAANDDATLPSLAGPVSVTAIESLREADNARVIGRNQPVAGHDVTHYRLAISAADFVAARSATGARLENVDGQLDVWLDQDGLPRRVTARFKAGRKSLSVDSTYGAYGAGAGIDAPADSVPARQGAALTSEDPVVANMRVFFDE